MMSIGTNTALIPRLKYFCSPLARIVIVVDEIKSSRVSVLFSQTMSETHILIVIKVCLIPNRPKFCVASS